MRPIALAAALAAGVAALAAGTARADENRLVTVVTAENPQTQLMAMVLTAQAVEQGARVHMLLCGPGGDIALADAPESATAPQPPRGASPQGLMKAILAAGATVQVCAIYLPGKDLGPEALVEGVTVAEPPAMARAMMDDDAVVWSF